MQRLILLLALLVSATFAHAQKTEGVVQFDEKINMHRNLPPDADDMRAMIPEFRTTKDELLFNATESLFRNIPEEEDDDDDAGGNGIQIKLQRPEAIFYNNFAAQRKTDMREFMGDRYLIEDAIATPAWKVTGETKTILGYNCMKAMMSDTAKKREVTVWFTDAIPVSAGPVSYIGLPGLVLEADVNQGEMTWTATKVEFKKLKKNELSAPSKGTKTTQAEFDKMVDDRMKAMGGSGGRAIKIIRN